jgi:hypothetical protein
MYALCKPHTIAILESHQTQAPGSETNTQTACPSTGFVFDQ